MSSPLADSLLRDKHNYALGIKKIDRQHDDLILLHDRMVLDLHRNQLNIDYCFESLIAYSSEHFATEEALMRETGCPLLMTHKRAHDEFFRFIDRQTRVHNKESKVFMSSLLSAVRSWIHSHLLTQDRRYADFLMNRYSLLDLQIIFNQVEVELGTPESALSAP